MGILLPRSLKLILHNSILIIVSFLIAFPLAGTQKTNDYDKAIRLYQSTDRVQKEEGLRILSLTRDKKAHQKLLSIATDKNEDKRYRILAIFLLEGLGKKEFKNELKKIVINDPDYEVSLMAAEALYMLGYKTALQFITDELPKTKEELAKKDKRIIIYAIDRLAALRADTTVPDLERLILISKDKGIIHKAEKGIKIIKGEIDYDSILKAQKKIELAYRAKEKGDIDIAIKNARAALSDDSTNEHSYWILGNIHAQMFEEKNKRLARDEFQKCLSYGFMDRGSLYFALGSVEFDLKEYKSALDYLQKASKLLHHEIVFYRLGQVYVEEGNLREAIRAVKKSIEINQEFTEGYCVLRDLYKASGNDKLSEAYSSSCKKMRKDGKILEP